MWCQKYEAWKKCKANMGKACNESMPFNPMEGLRPGETMADLREKALSSINNQLEPKLKSPHYVEQP